MVFNILDTIPLHTDVRVESVDLEPQFAHWLQAVGLEPGTTLRVLRRALWGGPLHVRSTTGGELAIHRSLARCIKVVSVAGPSVVRAEVASVASPTDATDLGTIRQSTA